MMKKFPLLYFCSIVFFLGVINCDAAQIFSTKEECEEKTGCECGFVNCDYIPPGKTFEEVCGKDFRKGWQCIRPTQTSKCSSIQIEGYKVEKIIEEDIDGDNQKEIIRIYVHYIGNGELGNKPIVVKVFSANENCPQVLFYYQGTGNVVWGTQVFSNFWGDGIKAVLIRDVDYAGGSGSTVNITFLTYRQGQYQIIKGPKFGGHDWRCCKFDGNNGLGKRIIGAEHWWGVNYDDYCAGCTSRMQFIIYAWNGKEYIKREAGLTRNKYGGGDRISLDEIIQKEPGVLELVNK